jgi:hypothetical protein
MAGDVPTASGVVCDRARQWSSLDVDEELSELERALLLRHLGGCGACRDFDGRLRLAAGILRTTPAEAPLLAFEPPRRLLRLPVRRRHAIAAVAAALALGSLVGALGRPAGPPASPEAPEVSLITRDVTQLREIPRGKLFFPTPPAREPGSPPEGLI